MLVFVSSADFGCYLWIKQATKLQCSKKVMYSHISASFVTGTILHWISMFPSFFTRGEQGTTLNTNIWGQTIPYKYPTQTVL